MNYDNTNSIWYTQRSLGKLNEPTGTKTVVNLQWTILKENKSSKFNILKGQCHQFFCVILSREKNICIGGMVKIMIQLC